MEENWKPIKNYEGLYEVSNLGRIKSLKRSGTLGGILRPNYHKTTKYQKAVLSKGNIHKTFLVHRLVAIAFVSNPFNKKFVNHINSNRSDNSATNLEWCTSSENILHGYRHGGIIAPGQKPVIDISDGKIYPSVTAASRATGYGQPHLNNMLRGKHENKTSIRYFNSDQNETIR